MAWNVILPFPIHQMDRPPLGGTNFGSRMTGNFEQARIDFCRFQMPILRVQTLAPRQRRMFSPADGR
jgi:hypothetical protein